MIILLVSTDSFTIFLTSIKKTSWLKDISTYVLLCNFEDKSALQAATILVAMASEKKFWRPKFSRKSPIGDQQIKRETYLKNYQ